MVGGDPGNRRRTGREVFTDFEFGPDPLVRTPAQTRHLAA